VRSAFCAARGWDGDTSSNSSIAARTVRAQMGKVSVIRMRWVKIYDLTHFQVNTHIGAFVEFAICSRHADFGASAARPADFRHQHLMEMRALRGVQLSKIATWYRSHSLPTLTFGVLTCFFVIAHDRRRVLHFNVTRHPTSAWVSQQLREAFPYDTAPKYLIHDRDAIFNSEVSETMKAIGMKSVRTSFKSPWQNGIAERFVGCGRRDLLDHVIALNAISSG